MLRSRTLLIVSALIGSQVLTLLALRYGAGLSSRSATILTSLLVCSACLSIVGERAWPNALTLRDYETLHIVGISELIPAAFELVSTIAASSSAFGLLDVAVGIPLMLAIQTMTRRVLFSQEDIESLRKERTGSKEGPQNT